MLAPSTGCQQYHTEQVPSDLNEQLIIWPCRLVGCRRRQQKACESVHTFSYSRHQMAALIFSRIAVHHLGVVASHSRQSHQMRDHRMERYSHVSVSINSFCLWRTLPVYAAIPALNLFTEQRLQMWFAICHSTEILSFPPPLNPPFKINTSVIPDYDITEHQSLVSAKMHRAKRSQLRRRKLPYQFSSSFRTQYIGHCSTRSAVVTCHQRLSEGLGGMPVVRRRLPHPRFADVVQFVSHRIVPQLLADPSPYLVCSTRIYSFPKPTACSVGVARAASHSNFSHAVISPRPSRLFNHQAEF